MSEPLGTRDLQVLAIVANLYLRESTALTIAKRGIRHRQPFASSATRLDGEHIYAMEEQPTKRDGGATCSSRGSSTCTSTLRPENSTHSTASHTNGSRCSAGCVVNTRLSDDA